MDRKYEYFSKEHIYKANRYMREKVLNLESG